MNKVGSCHVGIWNSSFGSLAMFSHSSDYHKEQITLHWVYVAVHSSLLVLEGSNDYRLWQNFQGENFYGFHDFSIHYEPFPTNYVLVNGKYVYKQATVKVFPQITIFQSKCKSFPPKGFAIYSVWLCLS